MQTMQVKRAGGYLALVIHCWLLSKVVPKTRAVELVADQDTEQEEVQGTDAGCV